MINFLKAVSIFKKQKSATDKSAEVVRKRLDELKLVVTYPDEQQAKMNIEEFQQALINFICDHLELTADQVSFTINKRGEQAICNMTVAIPDETMA